MSKEVLNWSPAFEKDLPDFSFRKPISVLDILLCEKQLWVSIETSNKSGRFVWKDETDLLQFWKDYYSASEAEVLENLMYLASINRLVIRLDNPEEK